VYPAITVPDSPALLSAFALRIWPLQSDWKRGRAIDDTIE
jgi:hypothetical protein